MRLCYDSSNNTLRLTLTEEQRPATVKREMDGVIDVAENGRLVGVELRAKEDELRLWLAERHDGEVANVEDDGSAYIALMAGDDRNVRSASVRLIAELTDHDELVAIAIPRRGAGYEITYPSGNR